QGDIEPLVRCSLHHLEQSHKGGIRGERAYCTGPEMRRTPAGYRGCGPSSIHECLLHVHVVPIQVRARRPGPQREKPYGASTPPAATALARRSSVHSVSRRSAAAVASASRSSPQGTGSALRHSAREEYVSRSLARMAARSIAFSKRSES